jgi:hypothetical protein
MAEEAAEAPQRVAVNIPQYAAGSGALAGLRLQVRAAALTTLGCTE